MFKFERPSVEELDIADSKQESIFKEINSPNDMSKEDAMEFWDIEFETSLKFQEYQEEYSDLLKESFGLSEEDFYFKIEPTDELKEIASKFIPEKWDNMTDGEKIDTLADMKNEMAKLMGLEDVPSIGYYTDEWGAYGFYNPYDNTISINIEKSFLSDSKELLNTLIHELRHAYQYERADILETKEDKLYRCNLENYISADKSFYAYEGQYVEAEARSYADAFVKSLEEVIA